MNTQNTQAHRVLASFLAMSFMTAAGLTMAQPSGNDGDTTCTNSYTTCNHVHITMGWTCKNNLSCCVNTYMSSGPDGQQGTSDDCVKSVDHYCGSGDCNTTTWVS